ncbi:MAG: hypothetical protein LQ348_007581 [Seirophora lacunosa]|nr:MAG: hypothetical protein LQ348_007581 [Seirophora lacunosa]
MPSIFKRLARGLLSLCAPTQQEEPITEKPAPVRLVPAAPPPAKKAVSPVASPFGSVASSLPFSASSLYSRSTYGQLHYDSLGRPTKKPSRPRPRIASSLYSRRTEDSYPDWDENFRPVYHQSSVARNMDQATVARNMP